MGKIQKKRNTFYYHGIFAFIRSHYLLVSFLKLGKTWELFKQRMFECFAFFYFYFFFNSIPKSHSKTHIVVFTSVNMDWPETKMLINDIMGYFWCMNLHHYHRDFVNDSRSNSKSVRWVPMNDAWNKQINHKIHSHSFKLINKMTKVHFPFCVLTKTIHYSPALITTTWPLLTIQILRNKSMGGMSVRL